MNIKKLSLTAASSLLVFSLALPAFATDMVVVNKDPIPVKITVSAAAKADADAKINARIQALSDLETRLGQMQKVSDSERASLDATLQSSISDMTSLKVKIDADTDATDLKTDIQSITKGYRIYLLVLPQGRIIAAADRVITISGLFSSLSAKLQIRITAYGQTGADTTALNNSLADINLKTGDANAQANAAIEEVANLQPDNGSASVYASNQVALKDAKNKIKLAISDLNAARQDVGSIVKVLNPNNDSSTK